MILAGAEFENYIYRKIASAPKESHFKMNLKLRCQHYNVYKHYLPTENQIFDHFRSDHFHDICGF